MQYNFIDTVSNRYWPLMWSSSGWFLWEKEYNCN